VDDIADAAQDDVTQQYERMFLVRAALTSIGSMLDAKISVETVPANAGKPTSTATSLSSSGFQRS
jgi:hypothetical protein